MIGRLSESMSTVLVSDMFLRNPSKIHSQEEEKYVVTAQN